MHRRAFVGLAGAMALASPRVLFAQAPGKFVRVGFLVPTTRKGHAPRIALPQHLLIRADRVIE